MIIEYISETPCKLTYVFGKDENGVCYIRETLQCVVWRQVKEETYNNMIKEYKNRDVK